MSCKHFLDPAHKQCAKGVNYVQHTGGAVFTTIYRLPCIDLDNRRGEVAAKCEKMTPPTAPLTSIGGGE